MGGTVKIRSAAEIIGVAALVALAFFWLDARAGESDAIQRAEVWQDSAAVFQGQRDAAREAAEEAENRRVKAVEVAEAARDRAEAAQQRAAQADTRIAEIDDTVTVGEARPAIDSTIAELTDVAEHWREAFIAQEAATLAAREEAQAVRLELEAADRRIGALEEASAALREAADEGASLWPVVGSTLAGGVAGNLIDGGRMRGTLAGAGGGFVLGVAYLGVESLLTGSLPLPFPF
jgi:hypothetical protein